MNPITNTRFGLVRYVVLYGLYAAAYTAAFGSLAGLPVGAAATEGAIFGVVSGFTGLILWNVLRYGTEGIRIPMLRTVYRTVTGVLFVAVSVGAECLAVHALTATFPTGFAATIPARILSVAAAYVCFVLWYSSADRSDLRDDADRLPAKIPAERPVDGSPETVERITVKGASGRIEVIGIDEIIYLRAEGDYVAIVTADGRRLKEGTMKWFEEMLPRPAFVRVHRSYIVAVGHISRIETSGREHSLVLRGGGAIRISDAGYRLLKQTLRL